MRECGLVTILPEKTRVAFAVRMSFAAVKLQKRALVGHLVLGERRELTYFHRIEALSSRNHVHHFRIRQLSDFSDEFRGEMRRAYAVGEQKHLLA